MIIILINALQVKDTGSHIGYRTANISEMV